MPTQSPALVPIQRVPSLTTLSPAVIDLIEASKRPNTLAAYRSDLQAFGLWCTKQGCSALPASPETVAAYLADRGSDLSPKTLQRHCASIAQVHRLKGLQSPTSSELVRTCLQGLRAKAAIQRPQKRAGRKTKAPALLREQVRTLLGHIEQDTGAGLRDTALLLVGYKAALRRSDLANLQWWQVVWSAEGVLLQLQASKTDKANTVQARAVATLSITSRVASSPCWARLAASTGTKAWLNAPSANSRRKKLGNLNATKKASATGPAPR